MRERANKEATNERRLLDTKEVCYYLSMGQVKGIQFAREIGAELRIGRRCLYDKAKIDRYLDNMAL